MMTRLRRASRDTVAFLFVLVSASAAGAACNGNVVGDARSDGSGGSGGSGSSGGGQGGPGDDAGVTCADPDGSPTACLSNPCDPFPTGGTPCSTEGVTCSYMSMLADTANFAVCYHGTWANRSCFGPVCVCPDTLPVAGSACDPCWGEPCPYLDDAGVGPTAQCAPDGTWLVSGPG
jgi:hypothetical protein